MKYGSADFSLYLVDGVDLLPSKVQTFTERRTAVMERVDGLGDKTEAMGPTGILSLSIVQTGAFFDDRQAGMHVAFKTDGRSRTVMYSFTGGKDVTSVAGVYRQSYDVVAQQGRLTRANVTYQVNGTADVGGVLVLPLTTFTGPWTGPSVDGLVESATGGVVNVQVTAFVGFTGVIVSVDHSSDNAAWTPLIALPTVTTAPATQRTTVAGTMHRYLRVSGSTAGTGSITLAVSVTRNP